MSAFNTPVANRIVWTAVIALTGVIIAQCYGVFDGMYDNVTSH